MRIVLSVLLIILIFKPVFSQSFHFNRQVKGVDLPTDNISGIVQDATGVMWFTTAMGVYYSDGFNTYSIADSIQSQLGTKIGIIRDEDDVLWLYNQIGVPRIFRYEDNKWSNFPIPDLASEDSPLFNMEFAVAGKGLAKRYFIITDSQLGLSSANTELWRFQKHNKSKTGLFRSVFYDRDAFYFFFENGAYLLAEEILTPFYFEGVDLPSPVAITTYDPVSAKYYFLGKNYLASGRKINEINKIEHSGFGGNVFTAADYYHLQLDNGLLFYFFNSQLFRFTPSNSSTLKIDAFIPVKSYNIYTSYVDREGIIWIGTHRGLVNINSLRFLSYQMQPLLDDEVTALMRLGPQAYLIGYNHGLQLLENGNFTTLQVFPEHFSQPEVRITNFVKDKNGVVWFSSNAAGIGRFDPKSRSLSYAGASQKARVSAVAVVGDSLLLVARDKLFLSNIYNQGEQHFIQEITSQILGEIKQNTVFIRKIGQLSSGKLILLQGGNAYINNNIKETEKLVNLFGYDFLEFEGKLLLGTETGLKYYENGELLDYTLHGQTISRPVYALLKDAENSLWIGTDQGVYVANETNIRKYDEKGGLIGSEINRGALIEAEEGTVFIGTQRGLSIYYANRDNRSLLLPSPRIVDVRVINQNEADFDPAKIPYGNNFIQITFQAVSFLQNADLNIRYKLEGYQDEWVEVVNPRSNLLIFSNLPPGNYKLLLQAGLRGEYNPVIANSDTFTILKPIYLQAWFIIIVLLVFLGIGFLLNILLQQWKKQGAMRRTIAEKTKEALNTEDQFKNVWNSSRDGLVLALSDGRIIAVNPSFSKLVGVAESSLIHNHIKTIFTDPSYFDSQVELLSRLAHNTGSTTLTVELTMPLKTGLKDVEVYTSELKSDYEGLPLYLSVYRDITQKKEFEKGLKLAKEKAEEANKVKSNFLNNMSHEIRTPLNGILGSTESIIMQRQNDPGLIAQLDIIIESGERLLHTINSILDLSKIEANKMDIALKETDINDFLAKILLPLKTLAIKKGLLLSARYESQSFVGLIDRRYFEMIVNNLVGNAIKYSKKGLIVVKVREVDDQIQLEVVDQGIGMSEDFLQKIFSPFEQESGGYGRNYEGSGLGLTITKNLVEMLGGNIYFSSIKNIGTHVTVLLPITKKN
jgi:PAS domain S-box-containing protein